MTPVATQPPTSSLNKRKREDDDDNTPADTLRAQSLCELAKAEASSPADAKVARTALYDVMAEIDELSFRTSVSFDSLEHVSRNARAAVTAYLRMNKRPAGKCFEYHEQWYHRLAGEVLEYGYLPATDLMYRAIELVDQIYA